MPDCELHSRVPVWYTLGLKKNVWVKRSGRSYDGTVNKRARDEGTSGQEGFYEAGLGS